MERNSRSRRVAGVVVGYYPDLGFGYLVANGERIGFKKAALAGLASDPRPGDRVEADVGHDGVALSVVLLRNGGSPST